MAQTFLIHLYLDCNIFYYRLSVSDFASSPVQCLLSIYLHLFRHSDFLIRISCDDDFHFSCFLDRVFFICRLHCCCCFCFFSFFLCSRFSFFVFPVTLLFHLSSVIAKSSCVMLTMTDTQCPCVGCQKDGAH